MKLLPLVEDKNEKLNAVLRKYLLGITVYCNEGYWNLGVKITEAWWSGKNLYLNIFVKGEVTMTDDEGDDYSKNIAHIDFAEEMSDGEDWFRDGGAADEFIDKVSDYTSKYFSISSIIIEDIVYDDIDNNMLHGGRAWKEGLNEAIMSQNEVISMLINEFKGGKVITVPDFKFESYEFRDITFRVIDLTFIMGVPHIIIGRVGGKFYNIHEKRTGNTLTFGNGSLQIVMEKAFYRWKYMNIPKIKVLFGKHEVTVLL